MNRFFRHTLAVALLCAGLSCASPARADQTQGVSFSPATFSGTVRHIASNGVWVQAGTTLVRVPPSHASFRVGTAVTTAAALHDGDQVTVAMPAIAGPVLGVEREDITVMSGFGYPITLPARFLTPAARNHRVCVQRTDGSVVLLPLNRALQEARERGVDVLGDLPAGTLVNGQVLGEAPVSAR